MELFPKGSLQVHASFGAINTNVGVEQAAQQVHNLNSTSFLFNTFFGDNESILATNQLQSGSRITLMSPSGPYSEDSVMVIAAGPDSFEREIATTQTIYDFPEDVQVAYFSYINEGLKIHLEKNNGRGDVRAVATENCIASVSNQEHRTSRSIALPHTQIFSINYAQITPSNPTIDHLKKEQRILSNKKLASSFINGINIRLKEELAYCDLPRLATQAGLPTGYSLNLGEVTSPEKIQRVMKAHHYAFKKETVMRAGEFLPTLKPENQKRIKPFPSYRMYMTYNDQNELVSIISPQYISHAGVIEAAGVALDRSPLHPNVYSEEEIRKFKLLMARKMLSELQAEKELSFAS
jgi:hypothetical protein